MHTDEKMRRALARFIDCVPRMFSLDILVWSPVCAISELEKMKVIASFYVSAYSSYSFLVNGLESQGKGWQIGAATLVNQPLSYPLETIPHSDFGSERMRERYPTRSYERDWCSERTGT